MRWPGRAHGAHAQPPPVQSNVDSRTADDEPDIQSGKLNCTSLLPKRWIDFHAHRAKFSKRVQNDDMVGRIRQHYSDEVAMTYTGVAQIGRRHVNAGQKLGVGDPLVPVFDGDMIAPIDRMYLERIRDVHFARPSKIGRPAAPSQPSNLAAKGKSRLG